MRKAKFKPEDIIFVQWSNGASYIQIMEIERIYHFNRLDYKYITLTGKYEGAIFSRETKTLEEIGEKIESKTFKILFGRNITDSNFTNTKHKSS